MAATAEVEHLFRPSEGTRTTTVFFCNHISVFHFFVRCVLFFKFRQKFCDRLGLFGPRALIDPNASLRSFDRASGTVGLSAGSLHRLPLSYTPNYTCFLECTIFP